MKKTLILILILVMVVGCGPGRKAKQKKPFLENYEGNIQGVTVELRDPETGEPVWKLSIDKINGTLQGDKEAFGGLEGLKGTLYENGKPALEIKADRCSGNTLSMELFIEGNVEGVSHKTGYKISADRIVWQSKQNRMVANGKPLLITKGKQIEIRDSCIIADTGLKYIESGD